MKNHLILFLLFLLIPVFCWAAVDTKDGSAITTTSNMDGSSDTHDVCDGQSISSGGGGDCPSGTYMSAWNGDYPSDTDKICINSGVSQEDENENISPTAVGTDYGESGSVGVSAAAADKGYSWTVTTNDKVNDAQGTVWIRIKFPSGFSGNTCVFEATNGAADDALYLRVDDSGITRFYHVCTSGTDGYVTESTALTSNTWQWVGFSWYVNAGNDMALVAASTDWGDAVEEDDDISEFDSDASEVTIGNYRVAFSTDNVYIDRFYVTSGYKDALPE